MFRARGEKDLLSSDAIFPLVVDDCLRCLRAKEKKQENEILSRGQPSNPPDSARPLPFPESLTFSRENEGWMRHISEDGIISLLLSIKNLLTLLLLSIQTNPLFCLLPLCPAHLGKEEKKGFFAFVTGTQVSLFFSVSQLWSCKEKRLILFLQQKVK